MGCDQRRAMFNDARWQFQSTHPHGVRLHIQQKAEYHDTKVYKMRNASKIILLKEIKTKEKSKRLIFKGCETSIVLAIL